MANDENCTVLQYCTHPIKQAILICVKLPAGECISIMAYLWLLELKILLYVNVNIWICYLHTLSLLKKMGCFKYLLKIYNIFQHTHQYSIFKLTNYNIQLINKNLKNNFKIYLLLLTLRTFSNCSNFPNSSASSTYILDLYSCNRYSLS